MSLIIDLSPNQEREIRNLAEQEGVSVTEYALRRLLPAPSPVKPETPVASPRYSVLQFADACPRSRPDIEAHIAAVQALRDEWDDPTPTYTAGKDGLS